LTRPHVVRVMPIDRYLFPEHDLMAHLVWGQHTSQEIIESLQALDASCATRWLVYLDATADMSKVDIAHIPAVRRVKIEKRKELFGDNPKRFAIACGSKESWEYFSRFWGEYSDGGEHYFRTLGEAYDWLGLSEAARAAVARAISRGDAEPVERAESASPPG
jgi:hypothetical protein